MATPGNRRRTTQRDRVEQAIAAGRTLDWIVDQLQVEASYVDGVLRRMNAAVRSKDRDEEQGVGITFPPAPPEVIAELIDAIGRPVRRSDPVRVAAVRRFVTAGCTDREIGAMLDCSTSAVQNLRRRNDIPSGREYRDTHQAVTGRVA